MKVLIVEDEAILAKVLSEKLKAVGFETRIAENGGKALPVAREFSPDIILLDLILPLKSGFQVLEELKGDPTLQLIPVIILSNLNQEEDIKKALQMGAKDYLVKVHHPVKEIVEKVKIYTYQK